MATNTQITLITSSPVWTSELVVQGHQRVVAKPGELKAWKDK